MFFQPKPLIPFIFFLVLAGCTTTQPTETKERTSPHVATELPRDTSFKAPEGPLFFLPALQANETVYEKTGYWLSFNRSYNIANWVTYELTSDEATSREVERTDNFHSDFEVKNQRISSEDYEGSGFDRGHLAPAGDMKWSSDAMNDSFLMTNMAPQTPTLNRGVWKTLEEKVRNWSFYFKKVYVITGPVLKEGLKRLPSGISIPERFYKVILERTGPEVHAIAFIISQIPNGSDLRQYAVTIDEVERQTNIDFFPQLQGEVESNVESSLDYDFWESKATKTSNMMTASHSIDSGAIPGMCPDGTTLEPANLRGCCSGHGGVAGPKKHRGCCDKNNRVTCSDRSFSTSCTCEKLQRD